MNNWIKKRCNKDNMWNLIFWLFMTIGWSLSICLIGIKLVPGLRIGIILLTIFGIPITFNRIRTVLVFNNKFFNKEGIEIRKYPTNLFFIVLSTLAITALIGSIIDGMTYNTLSEDNNMVDKLSTITLIATFFFVPTIYFIFLNCPISILFIKQVWKAKGKTSNSIYNVNPDFNDNQRNMMNFNSSTNYITNPLYSGLSNNIHNSKYHKK